MKNYIKNRQHIQGAHWRKLDNTAKLFAAVAGEDLSNVFRISVSLKDEVCPKALERALSEVLKEFESFRVRLRRGFFWNYFETNNKEPLIEKECTYPCKFIDPHSSHQYLFRVSYYKNRINLEVFHALTDGMGAVNFMKSLTRHYLEETGKVLKCSEESSTKENRNLNNHEKRKKEEDGYLRHYKKRVHQHYDTEAALLPFGNFMPLDSQNIIHGYVKLSELKALCREKKVSITKYLTALLIWSLIHVYSEEDTLTHPIALNLPINLRNFFDSDTMGNFFAVTNISWPAGRKPTSFEEVLEAVSSQMDEKIARDRLEEIISYNVSNEKKWYVRIIPLFIKNLAVNMIFLKSSKAYTMTLSNLGPVRLEPELEEQIEQFQVILGVSRRQKMKCGVIAFKDQICISFNSVFYDQNLAEYFFNSLRTKGVKVELESNGATGPEYDKGTYPKISYDRDMVKKLENLFYLILFTAAVITGVVNLATYEITGTWWSVVTIASIAYVALTVRYSITRRSSLAGIIVMQSLGAQALVVLIDVMTGYDRWSFNYVIPSVILFDIIAIVFLIVINRLNWQSYFMYQIAITIFSFIPLLLWVFGCITRPLMAVITVTLSVMVLMITVLLGERGVKKELKRRFHF